MLYRIVVDIIPGTLKIPLIPYEVFPKNAAAGCPVPPSFGAVLKVSRPPASAPQTAP